MSKKSEKSLKSANQPKLITFVVVNLVLAGISLAGHQTVISLLRDGAKGDWALLARVVGVPAVGTLAVGLLGWLIPREWKEVLVFWRLGPARLPSSEAFTKIAPADPRIDMHQLSTHLGSVPTDGAQQNTVWYSVYRKHSKEAAVNDANSAYLLYRDMTAIVPFLIVASMLAAGMMGVNLARTLELAFAICVEFLLLAIAARNAGRRLVANVLAIESARSTKPLEQPAAGTLATPKPRSRKKASKAEVGPSDGQSTT